LKQRTKTLLIDALNAYETEGRESKKLQRISLELAEIICSDRAEEEEVKKYLDTVFEMFLGKGGTA